MDKKTWYAHRLAYEFTTGPVPDGMKVQQRCGIRTCVNPDHLFLSALKTRRLTHCQACQKTFSTTPYRLKDGKGKFCSKACSRMPRPRTDPEERFWKYIKKPQNPTDCWIWTGLQNGKGYGMISIFEQGKSRQIPAHRFSYMLKYGPIPPGLDVCHDCPNGDNRACANPAHLFIGKRKENMQDASRKGRLHRVGIRGSANVTSKLTDNQVIYIRSMHHIIPVKDLAKQFAVVPGTITRIQHRQIWTHI